MASPLYNGGTISYYLEQSGMVNLQTKRGCPHGCVYCVYPSLEGNRFRHRDPGVVVDDIERLGTEHGADSFFFTDSIFNDPQGRYLSIAEEILRRRLRIRWCCYMRPERIGVRRSPSSSGRGCMRWSLAPMRRATRPSTRWGKDFPSGMPSR